MTEQYSIVKYNGDCSMDVCAMSLKNAQNKPQLLLIRNEGICLYCICRKMFSLHKIIRTGKNCRQFKTLMW